MTDNRLLKTLPWFIGGIALGATVGLLYAPKAGKETREDISDWLNKKREQTRELAARLRDKIPAKKEAVVAAFRAGKDAYKEVGNHRKEPVAA